VSPALLSENSGGLLTTTQRIWYKNWK